VKIDADKYRHNAIVPVTALLKDYGEYDLKIISL
jgi:hypothetical protein